MAAVRTCNVTSLRNNFRNVDTVADAVSAEKKNFGTDETANFCSLCQAKFRRTYASENEVEKVFVL